MQYRYVFFDLDGTLLDTLADLQDSVNTVIARYGLPPISRSEAAHFLGNGAKHLVHCSLKDRVSPEQEEVILDEYKAWYQDHCQIKTAPYPGIMELLANLKAAGCRMAVVSNKPDPAVRELNATFSGISSKPLSARKKKSAASLRRIRSWRPCAFWEQTGKSVFISGIRRSTCRRLQTPD